MIDVENNEKSRDAKNTSEVKTLLKHFDLDPFESDYLKIQTNVFHNGLDKSVRTEF